MDKQQTAERFGRLAVTEGKLTATELEREIDAASQLARPWNTWAAYARGIRAALEK